MLSSRFSLFTLLALLFGVFLPSIQAGISITAAGPTSATTYSLAGTAYTQTFDTLPGAGTFTWVQDSTLPGWFAATSAGTFNATANTSSGSGNAADLQILSVGTAGSTDRALSYHTRVASAPTHLGLEFVNNSGVPLTSFTLGYTAEQWRENTDGRTLTFTVQYRIGATLADLGSAAGWTTIPGLGATTLGGSATATATLTSAAIPVSVPAGSTLWIRWLIANSATSSTSSHDILAIDAVSFAATAPAAETAPEIGTDPDSLTVPQNTPASFTVTATGTPPLAYEWFRGVTSLGAPSTAFGAATFTLSSAQPGDAGSYTVTVSNAYGSVTSAPATLTVGPPIVAPTISAGPVPVTVDSGSPASFSVTATGAAPLAYEWFRGTTSLGAASTAPGAATLSIPSATPALAGEYHVVVSNAAGSDTSAPATLTVIVPPAPPTIATPPAGRAGRAGVLGGSVTFTATLADTSTAPFTFQWQKNTADFGAPIVSSALTTTLTLANLTADDAGSYRVFVTNAHGSATSVPAVLTVSAALPFAAFDLAGFGRLTTGGGVLADTHAAYRKVTNAAEFRAALSSSATKVIEIMNDLDLGWNELPASERTGRFRENATPLLHPVLLVTGVSTIDIQDFTNLTIFSASGATIRHAEFNVKRCTNLIIRNLRFDELWEWDESTKGDYDRNDWDLITVDSGSTNVWIDHCDFGKAYDGTVDLKGGTNNVTVSWCRFLDDPGTPGSWVRLQIEALETNPSAHGMYGFLRANGFSVDDIVEIVRSQKKGHLVGANNFDSDNADLSVTLHHNLYVGLQDRLPRLRGGNAHVYNVQVDNRQAYAASLIYAARVAAMTPTNATKLSNGTYKFGVTQNGAISTEGGAVLLERSHLEGVRYALRNNQTDPSDASYTGKIRGEDVIFKFGAIDFRGSSEDPGQPLGPTQATVIPFAWNGFTSLPYAYAPDEVTTVPQSLTLGAGAGVLTWEKSNWLRSSGYTGDGGGDPGPGAPTIQTPPVSLTQGVGTTASFSVSASGGTAPLSYLWKRGTTTLAVPSATTATLTLTGIQSPDAGSYTCTVTDATGLSVTSAPATLTVVSPPLITTPPQSQSVTAGAAASFSVVATSTVPVTYQWFRGTTALGGPSALTATLTLPAVSATDAGSYSVTVTNLAGSTPSTVATLTVVTPPPPTGDDLYVSPAGTTEAPGTFAAPTTLTRALTLVTPGRTIWVRGGTYASTTGLMIALGNDGLPSARKVLAAYPGETPVLDFSGQAVATTARGLTLNGNYWHLRGLIVQRAGDNGIYVGGHHNIVERCTTRFNADTGLQLGRASTTFASLSQWPSYNLILNCDSHDNRDPGDENADGFAAKLTSGVGNVFRGCIAHHNIDDGWDLFTKDETGPIGIVVIDQCIAYANGVLSDGSSSGSGDKNGFKLGGEGIAVNHIVTRSLAFLNGKNGFTWNSNPGAIRMFNNLAFNNAQGNFKFDLPAPIFLNNVSLWTSGNGQNDRYGGSSGIATGPSNVFWFASGNPKSRNDQGIQVSATSFVSLAVPAGGFTRDAFGEIVLGDFARPIAGSPLRNAGTLPSAALLAELPYAATDAYDGAPDIGAVETFTVAPHSYAAWVLEQNLTGADAARTADLDLDGLTHLLEFALGLSPTVPDAAAAQPGLIPAAGGGQIFRYTRPKQITGVTYTVQLSTDLVAWTPTAAALASETLTTATYVVALPSGARHFARLLVTETP